MTQLAHDDPLVLLDWRGRVAIVTLNDVAHRNVLSSRLVATALAALEQARANHARAIVMSANGKHFSAGADVREFPEDWDAPGPSPSPLDLFEAIERERRIVIAAVGGGAFGGGFELTLACDLVVAGDGAFFQLPEVGLGVVPNTAIARLPSLIGRRRALELIVSRRRLLPDEAADIGLVSRRCPTGTELDAAVDLATEVAGGAPGALALTKAALHRTSEPWMDVSSILRGVDASEATEGVSAFSEKRPVDYGPWWETLDGR